MVDLGKIDELVRKLSDSLPDGAGQLKDDMESRFRSVLKSAFEKMELVSREEFDVQKAVLERTRIKLDALERQLDELEKTDTQ
ncbi:MAG: accessory factor UbiK family protein [Xanthomonadales bacterium]|nr:accessory factor UbiK family protein [Gammaproteobacteria bacterium]NNE05998.1 accessory factor UbiK family protein [Xanthomonadales bacterium]NNL94721.1 accessory factor UbiK family protein [Xanthomonadales bacterium]